MIVNDDVFLLMLAASPDPVLIVADRDGEAIRGANTPAQALFGLDASLLEGQPLATVLPNYAARANAVHAGETLVTSHFVRAWARTAGALEAVTVSAVRGPASENPCIAVFIRSDALRLKDPGEAEISEARLQFALDSAGIGDWDMDLRTNTAFRSRLHDACFGYETPVAEWGYDTFLAHVHDDDRARVDAVYRTAMRGGGDYDVEFRAVWPDGSVHWLWSKGRFSFDRDGVPIRVAGIQVNISERKRLEERMQLAALALAATSEAVVVCQRTPDATLSIVNVNQAFTNLTGRQPDDVVGRNVALIWADTAQSAVAELDAAIAAGLPAHVTLRCAREDGAEFWCRLTASPLLDERGTIEHYVLIGAGVTRERTAAEEQAAAPSH